MSKRSLFFLAVLLIAAVVGSYAYTRYRNDRRFNGGEVVDETGSVTNLNGTAPVATPSRSETRSNNTAPSTPKQRTPEAQQFLPQADAAAGTPTSADSLAPNPPDRASFAGTGRFQVYRQGDLTWRLNTETGSTCILFATPEQWRKPIVYRNGCSGN